MIRGVSRFRPAVNVRPGSVARVRRASGSRCSANLPYFPPSGKWKIAYGEKGKGKFCDYPARRIIIDPKIEDTSELTYSLAHEVGHARMFEENLGLYGAMISREGMTREKWVWSNCSAHFRCEGEAELTALETWKEILGNGGPDKRPDDAHMKIYEQYERGDISRHEARGKIGQYFATYPRSSSEKGETYSTVYEEFYGQLWDKAVGAGGGASERYKSWFEPL